MATLQKNHFEGQTAGVTPTTTNSGTTGDDAFDPVSISGGIAVQYATDWNAHGTGSLHFTNVVAGSVGIIGYAGYSTQQMVQRYYAAFTSAPTASDCVIAQFRSSTGQLFALRYRTDGKLAVDLPNGSSLDVSTYSLPLNQTLRFDTAAVTDPANGGIITDVYLGDSTTTLGRIGQFGQATGTTPLVAARWGKITAAAVLGGFRIDDVAVKDGQTAYLGPYVPAPTVTGTASSGVWTIVMSDPTLTYTASPSAGVTQVAPGVFQGTTAGTYTVTATASNGGVKTSQFTVTAAGALVIKRRTAGAWATVS